MVAHRPPKVLGLGLQSKLASIVVHADEATSEGAHEFDVTAIRSLVEDPEVKKWLEDLGPLAPQKR